MKDLEGTTTKTRDETARFFHVSGVTIDRWLADGCPRNPDLTYNLYEVHGWLLERASNAGEKNSLHAQKIQEEIRKLQLNNNKIAELYILRTEAEKVLTGRAVMLRDYLEKSYQMTRAERSMRSVEELAALDREYVLKMMSAYCGSVASAAALPVTVTSEKRVDNSDFYRKILDGIHKKAIS
ncbi:MAG: hypothetical protein PHN88_14890 [Ignavibacteria bacterium]|nr:hypothetical protein [Ignavibacteria bacterium]